MKQWSLCPAGPGSLPQHWPLTPHLSRLQAPESPSPAMPLSLSLLHCSSAQCSFPSPSLFFWTQVPVSSLVALTSLFFFLLHSSPLVSYSIVQVIRPQRWLMAFS